VLIVPILWIRSSKHNAMSIPEQKGNVVIMCIKKEGRYESRCVRTIGHRSASFRLPRLTITRRCEQDTPARAVGQG